jgi:hypothetical protein
MKDILGFSKAIQEVNDEIYLTDDKTSSRYKVNAMSFISCILASSEWPQIWVYCNTDIYQIIKPWIVENISMT